MWEDKMGWQRDASDNGKIREATNDEILVDDPMDIDPENDLKTNEGYERSTMVQGRSAPEPMMQIIAVLRFGIFELEIHTVN
ncbi:hypothetical protein CDEST_01294 [Colletotrichum destructivum]|uniref:Uncharacterized protein n=1 Tax=Colletotrichum destructivum TaxID=34406 RepID=A0AAX4HZB5_9PEZI|nr:hypothetical protein CDEST_01294 [Colletotrichum destructivum]